MRFSLAAAAVLLALAAAQETSHSDHDHSDHDSHETSHSDHDSHDSHDSHDHGSHAEEGHFEAAAVYTVPAGTNSFVAAPAYGSDEASFAFMFVPAVTADEAGLEEAEEDAEAAWDAYLDGEEEPTILASGDAVVPSAAVVYQIALEEPLVLVPVEVTTAGAYAVLKEHGGDEVTTALVSPADAVLTAAVEEGGEEEEEEEEEEDEKLTASGSQWGYALLASILVSTCSLVGMLAIISKRVATNIDLSHAFIFAAGALLTASLLHIIPEAMVGLESRWEDSHDRGLYAGLCVLGGIGFGILVHTALDSGHEHGAHVPDVAVAGKAMPPEEGRTVTATEPPTPEETASETLWSLIKARSGRSLCDMKGLQPVCWNIIAGDLIHNFADGVAIGAAFLGCSTTMGWTVTASIILHEAPHEMADFMALLNGGMSVKQAFTYNFLSALTAVVGTVIILALGETLTEAHISIVLLLGAGSFIFIALAELIPDAVAVKSAAASGVTWSQVRKLGSFVLGALLIGVTLIIDEHCSLGHEGHNH